LSKPKRGLIQSQLSTAFSNTDVHSDFAKANEDSSSKQNPPQQVVVAATSTVPSVQPKADSIKPSSLPVSLFGVQTHALNVGSENFEHLSLPTVIEPPPLSLPVEEIEKDRALFRSRALKRVDIVSHEHAEFVDEDGWNEEEDVNGFANTAEGKKAKRKVRLYIISQLWLSLFPSKMTQSFLFSVARNANVVHHLDIMVDWLLH
jgi:hypothetical protein